MLHHVSCAPTNTLSQKILEVLKNPNTRKVIYGVTNRENDPFWLKVNDFFLDRQRFPSRAKARFFHSLKLLVASGVQFIRAIEMLAKRTSHIRFSRTLHTIAYDMEQNGMSFSESLQKYPTLFSSSEIKMIYSGELTGQIESTLDSIATQLQKNIEMEMRIRNALMYPITVLFAIFLAGMVVMVFIIPKLSELFVEFGAKLPLSTRIVMGISHFTVNFWWVFLTLILGFVFWFQNWKKSEEGKRQYDSLLLQIPVVSRIVNQVQTVRISQNFSALMDAGVPVNKALKVLSEILPNSIVGEAIFNIEVEIRKGLKIHEAFEKQPVLDPVLAEILEVGEKSGRISEVLKKLGDQYDLEVEAQLKNLTTVLEPIIIVVVGISVVFMMFAVLMPIFQIQDLFSQAG